MRPAALGALGLALAACGGGAPSDPSGFDRRLERLTFVEWSTGVPSAAAEDIDFVDRLLPADAAGTWEPLAPGWERDDAGAWSRDDSGGPVGLVRGDLDIEMASTGRLVLEVEAPDGGRLLVESAVELDGRPTEHRGAVQLPPGTDEAVALPIPFDGRLTGLALRAPAGVRIESVELVHARVPPGPSPRERDGIALDRGLTVLQSRDEVATRVTREGRRGLPARSGFWQVAEYEAGGDAWLYTAVALPPLGADGPPVRFELRARRAGSGEPSEGGERLHEVELVPGAEGDRWHTLSAALPGERGELWELCLVADDDGERGHAVGVWAEPVLVRRAAPRPPDLVLITADTFRADHLGAVREARDLAPLPGLRTPFLDALAADGTLYLDTLATSNATCPSHASILTGRYVRDHRVDDNDRTLAEGALTLTELLRERYYCVSSVAAAHLNATVSGLGQGFDLALEVPRLNPNLYPPPAVDPLDRDALPEAYADYQALREAPYANQRLAAFLAEAGELPLFLWLHYFDPHTPYRVTREVADLLPDDPTAGTPLVDAIAREQLERLGGGRELDDVRAKLLSRFVSLRAEGRRTIEAGRALYAAGISEFDGDLARLFENLGERPGERVVAFTADHGESLGEHGVWFGHAGLYRSTLEVPLILSGGDLPVGEVSSAPVSTVDLMPTLLDLAGVEVPDGLPGRSLVAGAPEPDRRRWFQHSGDTEVGFAQGDALTVLTTFDHRRGLPPENRRAGSVELVRNGRAEAPDAERAESLATEITAWLTAPELDLEQLDAELDEADRAQLRALGYGDD